MSDIRLKLIQPQTLRLKLIPSPTLTCNILPGVPGPAGPAGPSFALSANLSNFDALSSTGFPVRVGLNIWSQRSIVGTASNITVTNGDGIAGNPTIDLPNAFGAPGIYGSASQTLALMIDAKGRITGHTLNSIAIAQSAVTNLVTDLSNKQPLDGDLTAIAALSTNGFAERTGASTWQITGFTGTGSVVRDSSPALAGTPTAPTAANTTNTTQIATTAFVQGLRPGAQSAVGNTNISTTSSSFQDVTGLSVTRSTKATTVLVIVSIPMKTSSGAGFATINLDSVDGSILATTSSTTDQTLTFLNLYSVSAASHTWKARYRNNDGTSTISLNMSSIQNGTITVIEL